MLDLQSSVHFEEEKVGGLIIDQTLNGPSGAVLDQLGEPHSCCAWFLTQLWVLRHEWT